MVWFGLVQFYGIKIIGYLMANPFNTYLLNIYDIVSLHFMPLSVIHIKNIWFGFLRYNGISTVVGYLRPNPLYTNILYIYWISLCCIFWHICDWRLFNAKSTIHIYIHHIWFGLVEFYGISTIVGYLIPNPLYTYILNIYNFIWLSFMAYQPL